MESTFERVARKRTRCRCLTFVMCNLWNRLRLHCRNNVNTLMHHRHLALGTQYSLNMALIKQMSTINSGWRREKRSGLSVKFYTIQYGSLQFTVKFCNCCTLCRIPPCSQQSPYLSCLYRRQNRQQNYSTREQN